MNVLNLAGAEPNDIFFVDPFEVHAGDQIGRTEEIMNMAISLHLHGQRRPVDCFLAPDGHLLLKHGLVRTASASPYAPHLLVSPSDGMGLRTLKRSLTTAFAVVQ